MLDAHSAWTSAGPVEVEHDTWLDGFDAPTLTSVSAVYPEAAPPPPRTLLDIFRESVRACPDQLAIDDGASLLTYRQCWLRLCALCDELWRAGVGAGCRVGVRMPSGQADLYLTILAVLASGAAYVPVDHDDPVERAETVWREAGVVGVFGPGARFAQRDIRTPGRTGDPGPGDDAWVIFTSGSTGRPKGVAITHRSAAAFVDAEASLFVPHRPLGPGDRVLAGLSVAFDASCEEMWLAWRHGACLVPAPRALVRAGAELGGWLVERGVSVVSTVPTLAAMWPVETLRQVRLLILGGEACSEELAGRLAAPAREVWNTYGPTETTVVACAARLDRGGPVRIGLPLSGWSLAVLDPHGVPVNSGEIGELVIAGVGTGRYLDPDKDREKYRPVPALGWRRAYHSGDLVRADPAGLVFRGRADDQVKLGGRRIELGEIDAVLSSLPLVAAAAAAVRTTGSDGEVLVGYLVPEPDAALSFDTTRARTALRALLPAGVMPRLVVVDTLPTRTSGKVDRAALPWPVADQQASPEGSGGCALERTGTEGWLARLWHEMLATPVDGDADFFELGGTSLATAKLVARLRETYPEASVADVYQHPDLQGLAARLDQLADDRPELRSVHPTPLSSGLVQALVTAILGMLRGLQLLVGLGALRTALGVVFGAQLIGPAPHWPWLVLGWLMLFSPPGRLAIVVVGIRALRGPIRPGCYPRGGAIHLRLWAAERLAATFGMSSLAGTPLASWYARLLGCQVGAEVDLRTDAPVTGLLRLDRGCSIEPEVDLAGWWLDGDMLHIGETWVGTGARIGARATLMPGAVIGSWAEVDPGSSVHGLVPAGQRWGGVPAAHSGPAGERWPAEPTPRRRRWTVIYSASVLAISLLPILAILPGVALYGYQIARDDRFDLTDAFTASPPAALLTVVCYALLVAAVVRVAGRALRPGVHPTHSITGWSAWLIERLTASARSVLFPLYASIATPLWFRLLGAKVGRQAEISTATGLPPLMRIGAGAFLADDTLLAPYELRAGATRIGYSEVGRRAFAGNSSIVGPGRTITDESLLAVLSTAPAQIPPHTSWIGRPAFELRRVADPTDPSRTFDPPTRLVLARAVVELARLVPWALSASLATVVLFVLDRVQQRHGWFAAALSAGPALIAGGTLALAVTTVTKWVLVGRFRPNEHPLWSSFVWRNELFDTFYEQLAMPWLGTAILGTPMMNAWLRTLGAKIGRGVWCESHWLPETDLIHLADGATINRGCVLQTHLFHDRVMRTDQVRLGAGATLGPHSILLPGAVIGEGTATGCTSLVMRGERVPAKSRWLGNPIAAWPEHIAYPEHPTGRGRHLVIAAPNPSPTASSRYGATLAAALTVVASIGLIVPLTLTQHLVAGPGHSSYRALPASPHPTNPSPTSGRLRSGQHRTGPATEGARTTTAHRSDPRSIGPARNGHRTERHSSSRATQHLPLS